MTETEAERVPEDETLLTQEMDRLSLHQALRDFDVANARVVDLTRRLTTTTRQLEDSRTQLALLRVRVKKLEAARAPAPGTPARRNPKASPPPFGLISALRRSGPGKAFRKSPAGRVLRRMRAELRK